ncbi:hypothetical protein Tco_1521377, partial [Tanacetum coccineum]
PMVFKRIAKVAIGPCEVGLRFESDGFVCRCRGQGEEDR